MQKSGEGGNVNNKSSYRKFIRKIFLKNYEKIFKIFLRFINEHLKFIFNIIPPSLFYPCSPCLRYLQGICSFINTVIVSKESLAHRKVASVGERCWENSQMVQLKTNRLCCNSQLVIGRSNSRIYHPKLSVIIKV